MRLLDLGSGTGSWARAFRTWWPELDVVAVEPSAAMRERGVFQPVRPGTAENIPAADASLDGIWMSTVIHHVADLEAAAREIRRVLKPGAPLLIRSAFAGRHEAISLFRWFPEAVAVLDSYPSIAGVEAAFAAVGLTTAGCEPVPQISVASVAEAATGLQRGAPTPLQLITDEAYAAGVARLQDAARTQSGPVVDALTRLRRPRRFTCPFADGRAPEHESGHSRTCEPRPSGDGTGRVHRRLPEAPRRRTRTRRDQARPSAGGVWPQQGQATAILAREYSTRQIPLTARRS